MPHIPKYLLNNFLRHSSILIDYCRSSGRNPTRVSNAARQLTKELPRIIKLIKEIQNGND